MIKAYKHRIYPTKGIQRVLNQLLEECRWLYNRTLAYRKDAWEQEQKQVDWYETKRLIPVYKKSVRPTLSKVYSQALQNVTERVDLGGVSPGRVLCPANLLRLKHSLGG